MADIITTQDLSVEDTSKLKTGDMKRSYNMAKRTCPPGKTFKGGKCVEKKGSVAKDIKEEYEGKFEKRAKEASRKRSRLFYDKFLKPKKKK